MKTVDEIMDDVQSFASAWSMVGGDMDSGDMLRISEVGKAGIREHIEAMDRSIAARTSAPPAPAQSGREQIAYLVKWEDIGEGESESLFYGVDAKKHMESAVSYSATIPRSSAVTPLCAATPAPANALAIVQAALEAAATTLEVMIENVGDAAAYDGRDMYPAEIERMETATAGAKRIRAISPQSVIDSMEGK
jgi:hypothetical protein